MTSSLPSKCAGGGVGGERERERREEKREREERREREEEREGGERESHHSCTYKTNTVFAFLCRHS